MILVIDIPPQPWPKKLISTRGGKIRMYQRSNPKWELWSRSLVATAKTLFPQPLDGPVSIGAIFYIPRPKKPKSDYVITKPDLDNYLYGVTNLLKGIAYHDDNQIVGISPTAKVYGKPGAEIIIVPISIDFDKWVEKLRQLYRSFK